MRRKFRKEVLTGLILLFLIASLGDGVAHSQRRTPRDRKAYSADLEQLRTTFNQDKGKVRLLMLLSPT